MVYHARAGSLHIPLNKCSKYKLRKVIADYRLSMDHAEKDDPPLNSMVLCVDEKTQIQALDRIQSGLPLSERRIGSRTHDYKRHGTSCLYTSFSILIDKVIGKMTNRTRSKEFLSFIKKVDRSTPKGKDLHVILGTFTFTLVECR